MQSKQHIQYLDVLKGIVIFLVIVGHAYHFGFSYYRATLRHVLLSIDMPVFMFLAGYLAYLGKISFSRDQIYAFWRKKSIQLLLPLIGLPTLYAFLFKIPTQEMIWGIHHGGYWFTLVLFEIFVLYWGFRWVCHRFNPQERLLFEVLIALGSLILVLLINFVWKESSPKTYDLLSWGKLYYLYHNFLIGHFVARSAKVRELITSDTLVALASIGFVLLTRYECTYGVVWGGIPLSLLGLVAIHGLIYRFGSKETRANRFWSYLGRESRTLYLTHFFFLFPLLQIKPFLLTLSGVRRFVGESVPAILYALLVIALTLPVIQLIKSNNLLSLLCYGKQKRRSSISLGHAPSEEESSASPKEDKI